MQTLKVLGVLAFIASCSAGAVSYIDLSPPPDASPPAVSQVSEPSIELREPPLKIKGSGSEPAELNNRYGW